MQFSYGAMTNATRVLPVARLTDSFICLVSHTTCKRAFSVLTSVLSSLARVLVGDEAH